MTDLPLTASEEQMPAPDLLAGAFNAAPNGFVLIDATGRIVAANHALEAMFGRPRGSLLGSQVETLLPTVVHDVHVAHRTKFFSSPEPRAMGADRVLFGLHGDGHQFPLEIGLNPVPSNQGMLVLASVVDISERVALEGAFRGLFDASPYGLLIVDDGGMIQMVNQGFARALGYSPAALVGRPLHGLLPERYRHAHTALMQGYQRTGEARTMGQGRDLTALHSDGTELPVEIGLSRVRWRRKTMTLAAVTDISTRKRLELELRRANADLEEFSYVASHDLRSPLRGIAALIEWIDDDLGDDILPSVRHNLDRVSQRIARIDRLINDLLSYARAGRAATEYTVVDLVAVVSEILDIQPVPAQFSVEIDIQADAFSAHCIPLGTALRNLIGNAVKHHDRESGHIRITARHENSFCAIAVEDDGPGVPDSARSRIFKLFQTATAADQGGSGIGLALTKRLVETHGGRVEVESPINGGRGSSFRVWWPRFPLRTSDE